MTEPGTHFHGNFTFNDSQLATGDHAIVTQHNYGGQPAPEEQLRGLLGQIEARLAELSDPDSGRRLVEQIHAELEAKPRDSGRIDKLFRQLSRLADVASLAELISKAIQVIARHWPF